MSYKRISIAQAKEILKNPDAILVDIRDVFSYNAGHIKESVNLPLTQDEIEKFDKTTDRDTPLLVLCYRGNSSQVLANHFSLQGFKEVYSIDGGYEKWVENESCL